MGQLSFQSILILRNQSKRIDTTIQLQLQTQIYYFRYFRLLPSTLTSLRLQRLSLITQTPILYLQTLRLLSKILLPYLLILLLSLTIERNLYSIPAPLPLYLLSIQYLDYLRKKQIYLSSTIVPFARSSSSLIQLL